MQHAATAGWGHAAQNSPPRCPAESSGCAACRFGELVLMMDLLYAAARSVRTTPPGYYLERGRSAARTGTLGIPGRATRSSSSSSPGSPGWLGAPGPLDGSELVGGSTAQGRLPIVNRGVLLCGPHRRLCQAILADGVEGRAAGVAWFLPRRRESITSSLNTK